MAHYRTGTIAVTNGSNAVVGIGTDFISGAAIGECVQAPDGKLYEIASIQSATSLILGSVYLGSNASGQTYSIVPTQSYIRDLASQAAALVNGYASVQSAAGSGRFEDGSLTVPGIRFTADDNTGLRRTGNDAVAVVTGGVDRITVSSAGAVAIPGPLAVTGIVTGPTAVAATNTTQLATTAHVFAERTNAATLTNKTLTAPVLTTPALGTPASGVLTNATGLPVSTGIAGLGTGIATFLATPATAAVGDASTGIATTAFVQREKEYLPALSSPLHIGAVLKGIVYDTSKDSDGGAWRKRCQDKSWFTETLGGDRWIGQFGTIAAAWTGAGSLTGAVFQASATAGPLTLGKYYAATSATTATEVFRGVSRDFPAVAGIVAETGRVVIYDLSNGSMWMVFTSGGNYRYLQSMLTALTVTTIAIANGAMTVGIGDGLLIVNFIKETAVVYDSAFNFTNSKPIALRNDNSIVSVKQYAGAPNIVNRVVNDVAITVLDNAPIDVSTGLPVPTIACLVGESLVTMADGSSTRIDQIALGSKVKTLEGESVVTNWWDQGVKEVLELDFGKSKLICTYDHKIRTTSGWVEAQYLTAEHDVVVV